MLFRSSIPALLRTVTIDGIPTPLSSEFFAISADAHLVLGHIKPDQYSCDTPDKKEKTATASMRLLARVVCADLGEIGENGAVEIAEEFWDVQRNLICNQVHRVMNESHASGIVAAGIGAALFAGELGGIDLGKELGEVADALPAFAVKEVAGRSHFFTRYPQM